ncbi:MAG: peptidoglycan DD-metalloendopeptidase family protein [bacterium]|nr:peptidoglycan DD-metalloendopeptidase family protein [bacterium]
MAYVSRFCIRKPDRIHPFPIKSNQRFFILSLAAILSAAVFLPQHASAFWPFSTNADAAAANTFIPTASTPVLTASTNSNPNSSAPIALATSNGSALVSYNGPDGTLSDIANAPPPDRISIYEVKPHDTLSGIADMFDVSVNTIIWANNLSSAKNIHEHDILIILPVSGIERTVVKGDTLKTLAKKYGGDANEIAQFNGLDPAAPLKVGSTIIIPGGEIIAPPPHARSPSVPRESYSSVQIGYFSNPVPGGIITQGQHGLNGIDIGAARGTPVHAAAKGTVIIVRNNGAWNGGYGSYVVIKHIDTYGNDIQTLYSHMKSAIVSAGQEVLNGQNIGYVGATGRATGPHLHFEVRGAANPFRNCRVGSVCSPQ